MGLLKAGVGSLSGVLADSWREYFYCEALNVDTLVCKGIKKTSKRSSNTKASDNIISSGSIVAVADGQCMIIVEQGKVVEVCAEPGEFVFDSSTEPTIMYGGLNWEAIKKTLSVVGKRFTFGGEAPKDQRIYYFNTKEIIGNKFGTQNPVPFRIVVDPLTGRDVEIAIRCNGEYSYKIVDPLAFYANVCGNVSERYDRSEIDSQLKTELLTALQPAFGRLSEMGIRYSSIVSHTMEITDSLNQILSNKWTSLRGIKVWSFGINTLKASDEDEAMIKRYQLMRDPSMAAATIAEAQAIAMQNAAKNESGAMTGFMGMGFAQQNGGIHASELYAMGAQQQPTPPQAAPVAPADSWKCTCGALVSGKFCTECGSPKPAQNGWKCACGYINQGKFCSNCGSPKPAGEPLYQCDKCGWKPQDPHHPPRFCPECGDPFTDADKA